MTAADRALPSPGARVLVAAVLDVVAVLVFTGIGRRTHDEGLDLLGWAHTAWPFLLGLLLGWALVVGTRRAWPTRWVHGIPVWVGTLVGGMVLRALSGQGTAASFVLVATLFLAVTLVGWRVVVALVGAARRG